MAESTELESSPHCDGQHLVDRVKVSRIAETMPEEETLNNLAETFKVLSNANRLKIIRALSEAELCVCDLAVLLGSTDSAVSHQLRILRNMRLVKFRKQGKLAYYALDDLHVQQLFSAGLEHAEE
jgi:ArsR family transcriptional regulator